MNVGDLEIWQWVVGMAAALLVGCAKTGIPGIGILVVPLMVMVFGGKPSVGTLLPMLIFADCFAVLWYRRHAQWDKLWKLFPWVLPGMAVGAGALWAVDGLELQLGSLDGKHLFELLIGLVVLTMLVLHLLRQRMGDRLTPHSKAGVALVGGGTGAATTMANAAGPIMTLYLAGIGMPKQQFMGTNAWFFLILNLVKVPIFIAISLMPGQSPLFTQGSLLWDLAMFPLILCGVFIGKWLLPRIPQKVFDTLVLVLAATSALNLIVRAVI
ncbi:MAG: sulfite exporter TauE/SafE family protein [Planctomycetota bacterium]|jgi:uncharacterized membrane protein YfcA|nr:sulfite exporter TauE/SafE family protein [Planctomycetota bacterium]